MTRREKRIARLRARPVEADIEDAHWVLTEFGWTRRSNAGGSHVVYEKPGETPITVPVKGGQKVKRRYIDMICVRLHLDEDPE